MEFSLRGAVLFAPVPPATLQGMDTAATGGLSAAPASIQDHSGDVHLHSPHLVTDSLQSGREGEGRDFSESLSHFQRYLSTATAVLKSSGEGSL